MAVTIAEVIPVSVPLGVSTSLVVTGSGFLLPNSNSMPALSRVVFSTPAGIIEFVYKQDYPALALTPGTFGINATTRLTCAAAVFTVPGAYDLSLLSPARIEAAQQNALVVESNPVTFALSRSSARQNDVVSDLIFTVQGVQASIVKRAKFTGPSQLTLDSITQMMATTFRLNPFAFTTLGLYTVQLFADTTEIRQLGEDLVGGFEVLAPLRPGMAVFGISQSSAQPGDVVVGLKILGELFASADPLDRIRLVSPIDEKVFANEARNDVAPEDPIAVGLFRILGDTTILLASVTFTTATTYGVVLEKLVAPNYIALTSVSSLFTVSDTKSPVVVFSPVAGLYCNAQTITLTPYLTDTLGNPTVPDTTAQVYYSFDIPPTTTSQNLFPPKNAAGAPVPLQVSKTSVLWAVAIDAVGNRSVATASTYQIGFIQGRDTIDIERVFLNYIRASNTDEMIQALRVKYTAVLKADNPPGVRLVAPGNGSGPSILLRDLRRAVITLLHNVGMSLLEALPIPRVQFVNDSTLKLTPGREIYVLAVVLADPGARIRSPGTYPRVGRKGEDQFRIAPNVAVPPDGNWFVALVPSARGQSYFDTWVYRSGGLNALSYEGLTTGPVARIPAEVLPLPSHLISSFTVTAGKIVPTSITNIVDASRPTLNSFTDPDISRGSPIPRRDIHWRELDIVTQNAVLPANIPLPTGDSGIRATDPKLGVKVGESSTTLPNFLAPNNLGDVPVSDIIETARSSTATEDGPANFVDSAFSFKLHATWLETRNVNVTVLPGEVNFASRNNFWVGGISGVLTQTSTGPSCYGTSESAGVFSTTLSGVLLWWWVESGGGVRLDAVTWNCTNSSAIGIFAHAFSGELKLTGASGTVFSGLGARSISINWSGLTPQQKQPVNNVAAPSGFSGAHVTDASFAIHNTLMEERDFLCDPVRPRWKAETVIYRGGSATETVIARANVNAISGASVSSTWPPQGDVIVNGQNYGRILIPFDAVGMIWEGLGCNINPVNIGSSSVGFTTLKGTVGPPYEYLPQRWIVSYPKTGIAGGNFVKEGSLTQKVTCNDFTLVPLTIKWRGIATTQFDFPGLGDRQVTLSIDLLAGFVDLEIPIGVLKGKAGTGQYSLDLTGVNLAKFEAHLFHATKGFLSVPESRLPQPESSVVYSSPQLNGAAVVKVRANLTAAVLGGIQALAFKVVVNGQDFIVANGTPEFIVTDKDTATVEVVCIPLGKGGTSVNFRSTFTADNTEPPTTALGTSDISGAVIGTLETRYQAVPPRLIVAAGQSLFIRAPLNVLVEATNAAKPSEVVTARLKISFVFAKALESLAGVVGVNGAPTNLTPDPTLTTVTIDGGGRTVTARTINATVSIQDIEFVQVLCRANGLSSAENFVHIHRATLFVNTINPADPITLPPITDPFDFDIRVGQQFSLVGPLRGLDARNKLITRGFRARIRAVDAENSLSVQELIINLTISSDTVLIAATPSVAVNGKLTPLNVAAGTSAAPHVFDAIDADTVELIAQITARNTGSGFGSTNPARPATATMFVRAAYVPDGDVMPAFPAPAGIVFITPDGQPALTNTAFVLGIFRVDQKVSLVSPPSRPPPALPSVPGPVTALTLRRDIALNRALRVRVDAFNTANINDYVFKEFVVRAQVRNLLTDTKFQYTNSQNPDLVLDLVAGAGPNGTITGAGTALDPFIIPVDKPEQFQLFVLPIFAATATTPQAFMQGEYVFDPTPFIEYTPLDDVIRAFGPAQKFNVIPAPVPVGQPPFRPPTGFELITATGNTDIDTLPASTYNGRSRMYAARSKGVMVGNIGNIVERQVYFVILDPVVI